MRQTDVRSFKGDCTTFRTSKVVSWRMRRFMLRAGVSSNQKKHCNPRGKR